MGTCFAVLLKNKKDEISNKDVKLETNRDVKLETNRDVKLETNRDVKLETNREDIFTRNPEHVKILANVKLSKKDFSYLGKTYIAKVVSCYDGDTFRVAFVDESGAVIQSKIRMMHYDSPEKAPLKSNPLRESEKKAALIARDALINKINNELIKIECGEFDKYGRILITAYTKDGVNINEWMLANNYGVSYEGKKKTAFVAPKDF